MQANESVESIKMPLYFMNPYEMMEILWQKKLYLNKFYDYYYFVGSNYLIHTDFEPDNNTIYVRHHILTTELMHGLSIAFVYLLNSICGKDAN